MPSPHHQIPLNGLSLTSFSHKTPLPSLVDDVDASKARDMTATTADRPTHPDSQSLVDAISSSCRGHRRPIDKLEATNTTIMTEKALVDKVLSNMKK